MGGRRIEEALNRIDPSDRALLDLSIHRRFSDAKIAALLEVEEADVARQREAAIATLAAESGVNGSDPAERLVTELRRVPEHSWLGQPAPPRPKPPPPQRQPKPQPQQQKKQQPRRWVTLAAGAAGLAVIAVIGLALADSGSESGPQTPAVRSPESPAANPEPAGQGNPARAQLMAPLAGAGIPGEVTARLRGPGPRPRVIVTLDLPRPRWAYGLWLFNSLIDSVPLNGSRSGSARLTARLPSNFRRYRLLDLSAQLPDDTRHSGRSVFRIPLSQLRR